jgi:hypothetical protein
MEHSDKIVFPVWKHTSSKVAKIVLLDNQFI